LNAPFAPARVEAAAVAAVLDEVGPQFGTRITTARAAREAHGRGEGLHDLFPPDAVAFAATTEEVAALVRACDRHRVPIIPFGTGTSLEGHIQAIYGGISLDLSGMNRILDVSLENLDCLVEPGVTREQLNAHIRDQGLFFPLDPGANASLGGMAATRASGTNAVRYGTMRDVTLGLTVVTPQGEVVRTGGRARKSSTGYDLTRLYIGSEGTLGVITELRLRLFGVPETVAAAVCQFDTLAGAVDAVTLVLQMGVPVARIELLDDEEKTTLFVEFHGSPAAVEEQIDQVRNVFADFGGGEMQWARQQEERNKLWTARHNAFWAARSLAPGKESFATDACVPIAQLSACIAETKAEAEASGLICPIVGHVGDGNFHVLVLFDPADAKERAAADALARSIGERALRMGGTCSGEHGIGLHKLETMALEHGAALGPMRAIKAALDPHNIMNPGKTVPAA
jgi:D-lactate dehydrogenase (cytochrome)